VYEGFGSALPISHPTTVLTSPPKISAILFCTNPGPDGPLRRWSPHGAQLPRASAAGAWVRLAQGGKTDAFSWPDLSVAGEDVSPEIEEGTWEPLRDRIYMGWGFHPFPRIEDPQSARSLQRL